MRRSACSTNRTRTGPDGVGARLVAPQRAARHPPEHAVEGEHLGRAAAAAGGALGRGGVDDLRAVEPLDQAQDGAGAQVHVSSGWVSSRSAATRPSGTNGASDASRARRLVESAPPALGDLLRLVPHHGTGRTDGVVHVHQVVRRRVLEPEAVETAQRHVVDAEAPRRGSRAAASSGRLTGADDPAGEAVPPAGPDVLGVGAAVHVDAGAQPVAVAQQHRGRRVREVLGAHPRTGRRAHDPRLGVGRHLRVVEGDEARPAQRHPMGSVRHLPGRRPARHVGSGG
ncbi:hypothetical protein GCM10025868_00420 [Angustibacter aerolatus]|uniref:Uncharacterized protein n=1 Tax=Angustibacter aerolatus TaxID=1162965 RepID=A0ABQ6J9E9_9ACTN|nr:hypothetical protein GCM10025868_00420 [Angustibacter aerolatus]